MFPMRVYSNTAHGVLSEAYVHNVQTVRSSDTYEPYTELVQKAEDMTDREKIESQARRRFESIVSDHDKLTELGVLLEVLKEDMKEFNNLPCKSPNKDNPVRRLDLLEARLDHAKSATRKNAAGVAGLISLIINAVLEGVKKAFGG